MEPSELLKWGCELSADHPSSVLYRICNSREVELLQMPEFCLSSDASPTHGGGVDRRVTFRGTSSLSEEERRSWVSISCHQYAAGGRTWLA